LGVGIDYLTAEDPFLAMIALAMVTALIDQREAFLALAALGTGLKAGDRPAAEQALAALSPRDPVHLDAFGLARDGIEAATGLFARQGVAPILAYALFGVAGMLVWWLALAFVRVAGSSDPEHVAFGGPLRAVEAILAFVPLRLAGICLALSAAQATPNGPSGAFATMRGTPGRDWPQGAVAGALGLALGGPRRYAARVIDVPWVGTGRARAKAGDVAIAGRLLGRAALLVAALVLIALVARLGA
jgi:adenosylcobinamide-phosphate synthase